jgi:hypothetical protein
MAQGDAYIYHWTSYNNNNLSLQPSSGVEWMFVSTAATYTSSGSEGLALNTTASGSTYRTRVYTSNTSSDDRYNTRSTVSGGNGISTLNLKLIATNSYPLRYNVYNDSSTGYSRYHAIVINE